MPATTPQSILVMDDDTAIRDVVREILDDEGYAVSTADNGEEALSALRAAPDRFGLILLDLNMPRMTGWEFRRAQQQDPSLAAIPVAVMSAGRHVRKHGMPDGVPDTCFLEKPFELSDLIALVERNLRPAPGP